MAIYVHVPRCHLQVAAVGGALVSFHLIQGLPDYVTFA